MYKIFTVLILTFAVSSYASNVVHQASQNYVTNQVAIEAQVRYIADTNLQSQINMKPSYLETTGIVSTAISAIPQVEIPLTTKWYCTETNWLEWVGNEVMEYRVDIATTNLVSVKVFAIRDTLNGTNGIYFIDSESNTNYWLLFK